MKIKKGQLIALTNGEYSDYCLRGHVKAVKDFDTEYEIERFIKEGNYLSPPEWDVNGDPSAYGSDERFLSWAIKEMLIEPLADDAVVEWYYGSYSQLEKK